ncbi:hypothetical protein BGZ76_003708 [Entomortierella beljakovae]|nr:hypothetical protein BGZ76_003708 [Entomortierella beljakovae]
MKPSIRPLLWTVTAIVSLLSTVSTQVTVTVTSPTSNPTPTPTPTPPAPTPTQGSFADPLPLNPTFPESPRENITSPGFPDSEYVKLLDYSLLFYEAQRAGRLPADQRVKWRNNSVLNDGRDVGLDLSGGYFDAGDYLKFIFPLTFSLTETCWGAIQFWEGYKLAGQTQYLDQMVRWGMNWLINAHPNNNTLYVQVGLGEIDNDYWGPDTSIPLPRPSFQVNRTHPGTDVIADAAAAFASCAILYRDKLNDTAYSNILQSHATSLFDLAETATPQQVYQKVVPAAECCYASSGFVHELAWGAAWMYKLTKNVVYSQKAARYIDQLNVNSVQTAPVTWDDKIGLVYILMAGATVGTSSASKWQDLSEKFAEFTTSAPKPCSFTKGGLYYCTGNSGDDSAVVAANAAFALHLLADQMEDVGGNNIPQATADKINSYRDFALGQINYLLGDNPLKTPYVVGVHPNSPINPHSAPASGGYDIGTIDTSPEQVAYTIYGALVGGPDKNDRFNDIRSDWSQSEVALDYNAPFNGLMAYQVMTSTDSPPYVVIPAGRPELPPILNGMEVWQIILIVIGSVFVAVAIGACISYRKRDQIRAWSASRKQRKARKISSNHSKHSMKPIIRQNNNNSVAVPPPPPLKGQARPTPPPLPPAPAQPRSVPQSSSQTSLTSTNSGTSTSPQIQGRRPVPPPPLPPRDEPMLLNNARPS